jgi:hypothetical protein
LGSRFQAPDYGLEAGERDLSGRLARLEGMVREITSRLFPALTQTLAESPTVLAEFIFPTADYNSSLLPRLPHPLPQRYPTHYLGAGGPDCGGLNSKCNLR